MTQVYSQDLNLMGVVLLRRDDYRKSHHKATDFPGVYGLFAVSLETFHSFQIMTSAFSYISERIVLGYL